MQLFDAINRDGRVEIGRTMAGRLTASIARFFAVLPWALLAVGILFGIDFVGRATVDEPPEAGPFWVAVAMLALFASLVLAIARFVRIDTWFVDAGAEILGFETRRVFGNPRGVEVEMQNLRAIRIVRAPLGRRSMIVLRFDDGDEEVMCSTRLGASRIEGVVNHLERALEHASVPLEQ